MPPRPRLARTRAPVLTRLRRLCLGLPGATEEGGSTGPRWRVGGRAFAQVVDITDGRPPAYARAAGDDGLVLTVRAAGFLLEALRRAGPPYFVAPGPPRWGTSAIGIRLGPRPPWEELGILVAESHRLLAGGRTGAPNRPSGPPRRAHRRP